MLTPADNYSLNHLVATYGVVEVMMSIDDIERRRKAEAAAEAELAKAKRRWRGDAGLVRAALDEAGFDNDMMMFNDNSKDYTTRRIKVWFASDVVYAPLAQQEQLAQLLRNRFGNRILKMYSTPSCHWSPTRRSLCIKLSNTPKGIEASKKRAAAQPK